MEYTTIRAFDKKMREIIVRVWWLKYSRRWKHGTVKPYGDDVVICLKGGKIRDVINGEKISEYNMKHKIV